MLDVAVDLAIVKKSGAWYTYEGEQMGQGRENAKGFLADNLELMIEISEKVRQKVGIGVDDVPLGQGLGDDTPSPSTTDRRRQQECWRYKANLWCQQS
jgi:recombination protein RecA